MIVKFEDIAFSVLTILPSHSNIMTEYSYYIIIMNYVFAITIING